jgi:hypothetical protein
MPAVVWNVVSSRFVSGRYRRDDSNGTEGCRTNAPPRSASSSAPNTLGESRFGRQSQSIEPSRATSAAVRPSPIRP